MSGGLDSHLRLWHLTGYYTLAVASLVNDRIRIIHEGLMFDDGPWE